MATPRRQLVDPDVPLFYHVVSRCVRRSWLCGFDRQSRRDYTHRKDWLVKRLKQLGQAFAVDIYAYAIMSNHFHLVVYLDPKAALGWTDYEVVDRWLLACPPKLPDGSIDENLKEDLRSTYMGDREKLGALRDKLSSLSIFMKLLKQPIARRANLEDKCTGHFFDQRFYSGALLSNEAVLAAMAYVDLNPIRAKIAQTLVDAEHTSIYERLQGGREALEEYIAPLVAGLAAAPEFKIQLREYVDRLEALTPLTTPRWQPAKLKRWHDQVFNLKKRQRVYGPEQLIKQWIQNRRWQSRETPLPQ